MKVLPIIAICAVFCAVLFIFTLATPWYTITFHSEGRATSTKGGVTYASGEATATEQYFLYRQLNTSQGKVQYKLDIIYDWEEADSAGYSGRGGFRSLFMLQLFLVIAEICLFIGNGVLLFLGALGKMKKLPVMIGLGLFVLLMIVSSVYLPLALPPKIEAEPEAHLPGSVGAKLNESNREFVPYGVSDQAINNSIAKIMDVQYTGGLYGDDSSGGEMAIDGGSFSSESTLSWRPSLGWFAHVLIGALGVLMFIMGFKLEIRKKERPWALEEDQGGYGAGF